MNTAANSAFYSNGRFFLLLFCPRFEIGKSVSSVWPRAPLQATLILLRVCNTELVSVCLYVNER